MFSCIARVACLALALLAGAADAKAGDLAEFNGALESVSSFNRVAIGYLRTGNTDLASIELDRMRDRLGEIYRPLRRASGRMPSTTIRYTPLLFTGISTRLVAADLMLKTGRPDAARQSLDAIRGDFYDLAQGRRHRRCWPTACATPMPPWTR